ncbi:helix-turn-helix domain-containing protein [Pseudomonas sp. HR96]|uniref:helix-turn-helix domain-containing protein n=1 Tax=Pseudomonas sp. HR96 TaxID=1027966 RepID=UPI002A75F722|nr:helix-turn-helix domain-containing protein [Pseudomonas sp. HR96]WPP00091.1 helix-turn-helix domain-containing protein [Pseudomonas sp. HR96]
MSAFFPVSCRDALSRAGLLVKARRLALGLRQSDLKQSLRVSEHTLRKIESGSENVDLRAFMLVLWRLGIDRTVFNALEGIEGSSLMTGYHPVDTSATELTAKRVRLKKPKAEDF